MTTTPKRNRRGEVDLTRRDVQRDASRKRGVKKDLCPCAVQVGHPDSTPAGIAPIHFATGRVHGKEAREYLSECFQSANWLIKALHQRATTILKVTEEIVRQQEDFLERGVQCLRPMTLRQIAEAIEMHESTVSRVTANKYMSTPRGIYELKYFFTSSIAGVAEGVTHSAEAVRQRIKDLIDFPVEEATIDVFELPESRRPGALSLVYVVVAKSDQVEALGGLLQDAGLQVEAIDIAEMAIRNLALHLDRPGRPRAYLHLQPGQTLIEISDGSQIFLSRRVMQDYDENSDIELLRAQMENLALEVQRSLDYFESQYALGPADRLSVIADGDALFEAFSGVAGTFLTVPAERFGLNGMATSADVDLDNLGHRATAVGAAMRGLPRAA